MQFRAANSRDLVAIIRIILAANVTRLGSQDHIAKQIEGHFRCFSPDCEELRATVNSRNHLARCFSCGQNFNNIDLLMTQGYDFVPAVEILEQWLRAIPERSRQ